jgi:hypothetical protein
MDSRVVVYDDEVHLDLYGPVAVGDVFPVYRGGGRRDGDLIGSAIIVGFDEDGAPQLTVRLGGSEAGC